MIKKSLARTYARALIKSATDDNMLRELRDQLRDVAEIISSSPELEEMLSKPILGIEKRRRILESIISKVGCSKIVSNLLIAMLSNYRLHYINLITGIIDEEIDQKEGV